jgi:superfamily II DNA or RNA helicase
MCVRNWINANGYGTVNAIMGFGKTRIAKIISDGAIKKNPSKDIIAIAPNRITTDNLIKNLSHLVLSYSATEFSNILKMPSRYDDCQFVIIDEIHKFFTPEREKILEYFSEKDCKRLGLTGSTLSSEMKTKLAHYGFPVIDVITEEEAINNEWISPYREYNLAIPFPDDLKEEYANFTEKISKLRVKYKGVIQSYVYKGKPLFDNVDSMLRACLAGIKVESNYVNYNLICDSIAAKKGYTSKLRATNAYTKMIIDEWSPSRIHQDGKTYNNLVRERYNLISCNSVKLDTVVNIIKNNDVPTIVFNDSTLLAEKIGEALGNRAIVWHSSLEPKPYKDPDNEEYYCFKHGGIRLIGKDALRKIATEGMLSGKYKYLICVKAMNEGLDIPLLQQVITTAGDTNVMSYEQRIARGKRLDKDNEKKVCTIINCYHPNFMLNDKTVISRDYQKLMERQTESAHNIIWIDSVDEIII